MEAKLFTHTDLDGAVSNLIALKYFIGKRYKVSTDLCTYGNVDKNIMGYFNSFEYNPEAVIVVTDISFSKEVAEHLDKAPNKVIMIDHHKSAEELFMDEDGRPIYDWMTIFEGDSASFLTYKYFMGISKKDSEMRTILYNYKVLVYITDLWDTKSRQSEEFIKYDKEIRNMLNLFKGIGFNAFKDRFFQNPSIKLMEKEEGVVETVERLKRNSMKKFQLYVLPVTFRGETHVFGFGFASDYISEVAEYIFDMNDKCLFSVTLDMNYCSGSFRRNQKHPLGEEVDVEELAKQFGGGGHPFAAGFEFEIKDYDRVIKKIINSEFNYK